MKKGRFFAVLTWIFLFSIFVFAQGTVVLNNPLEESTSAPLAASDERLIKRQILPKARKHWAGNEMCEEDFAFSGSANGAFTRAGAKQLLVFYQFCQTGNGLGNNGLVLLENGKIIGSYISEGGWAQGLKSLPDINRNGLDEFLVYYSGGMHQGAGGVGVDLMEFSGAGIKGIGWFQADSFNDEDENFSYKVTAKPAKIPVFYRERYDSTGENKWKKTGKISAFKLGKAYGKFTVLK
jgi:hypothetical protein